ncbi:MAG: tRNA epoxyqueuosine(34) reductase QueG [Phycisphaerales bacterium]|nr:tRNA epoxyqueuosine(34) reductase QueG [Phycisphaerales bacterium]
MTRVLDAGPFVQACLDEGFALAGVTTCEPPATATAFESWLAEGCAGSMEWMHRAADVRADPGKLLEGAKSIIVVADRYEGSRADAIPVGSGRVAAYAKGRDYHRLMKRRLHQCCDQWSEAFPEASFRACVDTAPLLERAAAEAAGLGRVGKNTMLIEPGTGSWLLLGEVLTTLSIAPTPRAHEEPCGTCTRCIDACPTDALSPWKLDARRCIAALTIEERDEVPATFASATDDWLFGCDICQQVCPHNGETQKTRSASTHMEYAPRADVFDVEKVLDWTAEDRVDAIAGTAMTRASLDMWRRNACVVAGNILANGDGSASLRARLNGIVQDGNEAAIVRSAARVAIGQQSD